MTAAAAPFKRDFGIPIALGCVAAGGAAIGLAFPLLAYNLDDWGVSEGGIGLFTLASALSTVVATPFIPPLLGLLRTRAVLALALLMIAAAFAGYFLFPSMPAWFGLRFMAGVAFSLLFVSCEAWALDRAPAEKRGLIMGLFASTFAGAMAMGGAIIALVGYEGPAPFLTGAGIALVGLLLLLLPARTPPAPEGESAAPKALLARIKAAPILMLAPLAMGAIETAKYNLIAIYARRVGLSDETGAAMITAAGLGVLLFQPLIGMLADRIGVKRCLVLCCGAGLLLPLVIAAAGDAAWPALAGMFFYSGLVTGLYTVGIVWLGRRFVGAELAAGNAAFALCYGLGQMLGPAGAGLAFDAAGPWGFMGALAAISGVYLVVLGLTRTRPA
jgi:predicted MFS family arabinose efflux permease